jgi:phage terminase small subunit
MATMRRLTGRQFLYCQALISDPDQHQTRAAIKAGYAERNAAKAASALMLLPHVKAEIQRLMKNRAKRHNISSDTVLSMFWDIATLDRTEMVNLAKVNCRYCNGTGHHYQFKHSEFIALDDKRKKAAKGGSGFDEWGDPDPDCPECFGEGQERLHSMDTRHLPDHLKRLITGMKNGKNGLELTFRDPDKALDSVARHLGMYVEKLDVNVKFGLAEKIAARRAKAGKGGE